MNRLFVLLRCLACALIVLPAAAAAAADPAFLNPLVRQRADPHVVRHTDGYYYLTATVPEYNRIVLRRARSLDEMGAADEQIVWRKHAAGPMSAHIWAPELHFIDGKWYLYFTAGRADAIWDIRLYVLENSSADPMTGQWIERGQIDTGWESFALDATTFALGGQRYLVWTQRPKPPGDKVTNIYIAKMDTPTSILGPAVQLSTPEHDWEKVKHAVNEAPALLVKNGKVFLTYSASATDANYSMGMLIAAASANLLDPAAWVKSRQPVFSSSAANGQYGPGHNAFTTTPDGKTDVLVYHARNYRDISGDPLRDPNRHARAQAIGWRADGTPDFGVPVADLGGVARKPLFRDPVFDGAADPVVIRNAALGRWWMFYTNRRAKAYGLPGFSWVHGSRIGIAESVDGASWKYVGTADIELPPEMGGADATHWAPDIVRDDAGKYHMFLTVVPGVFEDWKHPRHIVHLTSADLRTWRNAQPVKLASEKVIDAAVARVPGGGWRMWYNNEADHKSIYSADSADLISWTDHGRVVADQGGEGPKVFQWRGAWWMITDVWRGLAVYRSADARTWKRQSGNLLETPGQGVDDQVMGGHADVVVSGDRAFLFYFTHPGRRGPDAKKDDVEQRRSAIQVTELFQSGDTLRAERDTPTRVLLRHDNQ